MPKITIYKDRNFAFFKYDVGRAWQLSIMARKREFQTFQLLLNQTFKRPILQLYRPHGSGSLLWSHMISHSTPRGFRRFAERQLDNAGFANSC
jgi:hypothetical protein